MNVLIIGKFPENLLDAICESKLLDKLYTALEEPLENFPNIEFSNIEELVQKASVLKIDIAITTEPDLIEVGIADIFKKNRINMIAVNQKWFNLESSRLAAKQLLNYYSFNTPKILKAPISFPVIIKTDRPKCTYIAKTMQDLVNKMEELEGERTFLEEYLDGKIYEFLSLWDGKNLFSNPFDELTEVQADRLKLYKTKLNFMLSDENADFTGFFTSRLIWAKNDWYVLEYKMRLDEKSVLTSVKTDFLYLLNSAIYQKLHEL